MTTALMRALFAKTRTVTTRRVTRNLELDADQVQSIVIQWAREHHGFSVPMIDVHGDDFSGMEIHEVTIAFLDDTDTPVEEV
jgi:hypothetical protein